jgi:hypothetical protein
MDKKLTNKQKETTMLYKNWKYLIYRRQLCILPSLMIPKDLLTENENKKQELTITKFFHG